MNVKSFFLFRILVETKENLFPPLLRKHLRIILLLRIFIFIPLALWYYLSLVQSKDKIFALCFGNVYMFARSVGFNKFIHGYKPGMCYSAKIFYRNKKNLLPTLEVFCLKHRKVIYTVGFSVKKYKLFVYFCKTFWRRHFITCEP